jgi:hypothetical protein
MRKDVSIGAEAFAEAHPELVEAAREHVLNNPGEFAPELVETARRGRKPKGEETKDVAAMVKMNVDIETADRLYGDDMPYELDRIENEIRFYQEQAGQSLLEMGKRFIRIKTHEEHGRFLKSIENVNMTSRSVQYAMVAAIKFSNTKSISHLGTTKMIALSVLDDDDVQKLEAGSDIAGMNLDDIDRMTTRELRENLRKEKEKVKEEKESRKQDRDVQEKASVKKEQKLNELEQQLRYQQPPTKEQLAKAALFELNKDYTYALAEVTASIRKAHGLVVKAERFEGVDVQMLQEWLIQFDREMRNFDELKQAWLDEVDNAGPIKDWRISDLPDGSGA